MQKIDLIDVNSMMAVHDSFKKYEHVQSVLICGQKEKKRCKYSIVIPTFKRVNTLIETIQSSLKQDGDNDYNIIIVDNNPEREDETEQYITNLHNPIIKYYKNEVNIGMTGNWNRCLELCEGEFAILLHDDDLLLPSFLSCISNVLLSHRDVDVLYVGLKAWHQDQNEVLPIIDEGNKRYPLYKASLINCLFTHSHTPTGIVLKKDSNIRLGGFDERTYPSADYYYYSYATVNGLNVYNYTKPLIIYRKFINESLNEQTKLNFIIRTHQLHRWLLDKMDVSTVLKKWLISVKINTALISCKAETIRGASLYNMPFSKVLLLRKGIIRNVCSRYYDLRLQVLKHCIYRNNNAVDFI